MSIHESPMPPGNEGGIASHQHTTDCCNATTSFIHVYHHNSDCTSNHNTYHSESSVPCDRANANENNTGNECSTATSANNAKELSSASGTPFDLFKQVIDGLIPAQKRFDSNSKTNSNKNKKPNSNNKTGKNQVESTTDDTETDLNHKNLAKSKFFTAPGDFTNENGDHNDLDAEKDFATIGTTFGTTSDATEDAASDTWEDDLVPPPPPVKRLWGGIDGIAVMTFGVLTPVLLTAMAMASCPKRITLVLLNHPVETLIELLLLCAIPLANYKLWSSVCKNDMRFSLLRGLIVGAAVATSLVVAVLSFAAIPAAYQDLQGAIGTDFSTGFFFIGLQALTTAAIGLYLIKRTRMNREFASSKARIITYTLIGFAVGIAAFAGSEIRSWSVRLAEKEALSANEKERAHGLAKLRALDTERELRMETSDSRAAGIAGLFIPVKHSEMSKLYFTVCGKPLGDENSADFSSMSDDYLQRHVVGSQVKGLGLARSAFNGMVSPDALTSTINWTFVFRNDTETPQEARAELALPPGAVINGLTVWKNGDPLEASFAAAGKAEGDGGISWVDVGHDNPAIVTDLGRGRHLFHCYPIPHDEQLKVNISIVVPLKLESLDNTSLTFPHFIASNFSLEGEHVLTLESTDGLSSRQKNITTSKGLQGRTVLSGALERSQLEHTPLIISAQRAPSMTPVATFDKIATTMELKRWNDEQERKRLAEEAKKADEHQVVLMIDGTRGVRQQIEDVKSVLNREKRAKKQEKKPTPPQPKYAMRTITEVVTKAPKRLLVVIDGSSSIKDHMKEITSALKAVPSSVPVWVRVASRETDVLSKPTPLKQALPEMEKIVFAGGQDNLKAVVNAAEMAGETEGGAVLWIHGPQPGLNKDIYIMSPFRAHPSFFELALDTGCTDTIEYFKNHAEVGPFSPIQRTKNLTEDLNDFFLKWQAGRREFVVNYKLVDKSAVTKDCALLSERDKNELLQLQARSSVDKFIREKKPSEGARLAVEYQFVSPVSCVAVIDSPATCEDGDNNTYANHEGSETVLQGASNGTISPQGKYATSIMGVNTAGTVRVNNLANLEALLNMICNLVQLGAMVSGALVILHGIVVKSAVDNFLGMRTQFTPGMRLALGATIIFIGCMVPGLVNWFVASARDANLFS